MHSTNKQCQCDAWNHGFMGVSLTPYCDAWNHGFMGYFSDPIHLHTLCMVQTPPVARRSVYVFLCLGV